MIKKIKKLTNDDNAGVLDIGELASIPGYTEMEDLPDSLVAIIECDQDIPCNPCESICPSNAICVGEPITNLPTIDISKCNGCLSCLKICPGLCIFAVKRGFSSDCCLVYIPYEYIPLPEKGSMVRALDRRGEFLCEAKVYKILGSKKKDDTKIVGLVIPKEFIDKVRNFEILPRR